MTDVEDLSDADRNFFAENANRPLGALLQLWVESAQVINLTWPGEIPLVADEIRNTAFYLERSARKSEPSDIWQSGGGWADLDSMGDGRLHVVSSQRTITQQDQVVQERIITLMSLLKNGTLVASGLKADYRHSDLSQNFWITPPLGTLLLLETSEIYDDNGKIYSSVVVRPRLEKTDIEAEKGIKKGGRPDKYDWDRIIKIILGIANTPDGLPAKKSEIVRQIQDAYALDHNGEAPSDTQLKDKLKSWLPDNWEGNI